MKVLEFVINENEEISGVQAISLVEKPAIEKDFIALKNEQKEVKFTTASTEKRIVTGPALVPQKLIYRKGDSDSGEYYMYFTDETIEKASQLYLKDMNQFNTTLEHETPVTDIYLVESWIKTSNEDKSTALGIDVPNGTWMVSLKIDNDEVWNDYIKNGAVKGFSIEGLFSAKVDTPPTDMMQQIKQLLQ